jgi:hypothetical protein
VNASLRGLIPATPAQPTATQASAPQVPVPPGPQAAGQSAPVKDTEFFKEGTKVA